MLTFVISVIFVSFVCLCFFKKKFWENRYLILFISGSVALVATVTINFSVRGNLQTKTEVLWNKQLVTFYLSANLFKDTTATKTLFIKNYNYYDDHKANEFKRDTTKKQIPFTIILYQSTKESNIYVGTMKINGRQDYSLLDKVYIVKSNADTIAYVSRNKLFYDVKPNNWITGFSLPRISTITVFHIPPKEFAMIPDSLIRKVPF